MNCAACFENDTEDSPVDDVEVEVIETGAWVWIPLCRLCTEGKNE